MTASFLLPFEKTCQDNLLAPKWLIAPNRRTGIQWKDHLNFRGVNTVNVHIESVKSLVFKLVSAKLAKDGVEIAARVHCLMLIGKILTDLLTRGQLEYFHEVKATDKLAQLLTKTLGEIRLGGLGQVDLKLTAIESPEKAADLQRLINAFDIELKERKLFDYADCLSLAISQLEQKELSLPDDLIVVSPVDLETSDLEKQFLRKLKDSCAYVGPVVLETNRIDDVEPSFKRAMGEINEIQLVLQNAFENVEVLGFDQIEILHTDYSTYVPLIHEQLVAKLDEDHSSIDELPVTFGDGLACIYSRPGRALRSWVRWQKGDFLQNQIVRMIREGLIRFDNYEEKQVAIGFSQLAHRLRKLPIGFGYDRYKAPIAEAIKVAEADIASLKERRDDSDFSADYDFGKSAFEQLEKTLGGLIDLTPREDVTPKAVLSSAKQFLSQFARSLNKLDGYAKQRLLSDIEGISYAIESAPDIDVDVWALLEQLPVESRILASGPRPGRIHVDHIARGGHSGRESTFVVGLDDSRFPFRGGQDPLLLDLERRKISADLPTAAKANVRSRENLRSLLDRISGNVSFSYATYSLAGDREQFPSTALLETYRALTKQPTASLHDFEAAAGTPVSYCSTDSSILLSQNQWWQAKLNTEADITKRNEQIEAGFPHFKLGQIASSQRESELFTQFDGCVPSAGKELDPTGSNARRTSPSRLETFGVCPRKFFFRYGLGIYPPDEHKVDNERWLDALQLGSLVHEVFEDFLRSLTEQGRVPEMARDLGELKSILHSKIEDLKSDIPIPNQDAFERQLRHLEKSCEIFLRKEEEYCLATNSVPWILEASIGLGDEPRSQLDCSEPVSLTLKDGRRLKVGGRIDRIDRIGGADSVQFGIWDYKSGSKWGFDQSSPFQQGRKLQPFLYAGMLRHRLAKEVGPDAKPSFFGYFFPSPKTEGLRLRWTSGELKTGDQILSHICDAISTGTFIATNDEKDCGFCEYLPICGDPKATSKQSLDQLKSCSDSALNPIRSLREIVLEEAPPW